MGSLATDSVNGAVIVAIASSMLAALGWVCIRIYEKVVARQTFRKQKNEALIRFYIDLKIKEQNIKEYFTPPTIDALKAVVRAEGVSYRGHVAASGDNEGLEAVRKFIFALSPEEQLNIEYAITNIVSFDDYYRSIGSDSFKDMSVERKIRSLDVLLELANRTKRSCQDVTAILLENHELLRKYTEEIKRILQIPAAADMPSVENPDD